MSTQPVIVEQVKEKHLPIFAHTVKAFRNALSASVLNWKDIGDIILKDPGLVLQTIQLLKSGSKRAASLEITNMSQAVMLMGMDRVRSLLSGLPVLEQTLPEKSKVGYTKAVNRSLHAAFQARNWAQWRNDFAPEVVYIATLLHDIPELALWVSEPRKMYELRRRVYKDGMSPDEAHHITLGQSLQHYGRQVTSDLHLPTFVHDVLRPENASIARVQNVLLAVQLANSVEFGWYTETVSQIIGEVATHIKKNATETVKIIHQNALYVAHDSPFTEVKPAAALLALIHSDDDGLILEEFPDGPDEVIQQTAVKERERQDAQAPKPLPGKNTLSAPDTAIKHKAGSITVESASPKPRVIPAQLDESSTNKDSVVCLSPQPALFAQAVKDLESGMGTLDANQIIRIAVHGMHEGIGLHRVVFVTQVSKRPYLEARCMAGTDNDPAFNRFQIKLDRLNLFSRLLEKPSGIWINDENRGRYWQSVPDEFKVLVKVNSFCAMSVFVDSKPAGLFYADRHSLDCRIDKQAFTQFRHLGLLASKCLATRPKANK